MFEKILKTQLFGFWLLSICLKILVEATVPVNETSLLFYYGPKFTDSKRFKLSEANQILNDRHFKKQETHLYFHGWKESQTSASHNVPVTVDAYLKRKDINLITVDWAKAAAGAYHVVVFQNMPVLAPVLADVVLNLYKAGLGRKELMVVGHSLGAQLAGMMGRNIIRKTRGTIKIHRMASLDASLPLFVPLIQQSISRNDADFLQMIHTEIGTFGQPFSLGHVNFWPNGGHDQPGCSNGSITLPFSSSDICSHRRSWRFWAESVANVNNTSPKFLGFPAYTYREFLLAGNENLKNKPVEMGINCPISAREDYFLKTNSQSPFAKGMDVN